MSRLLRLPSVYLAVPILLACALTLLSYDLPGDYLQGMLLLVITALGILLFDVFAGPRLPPMPVFRQRNHVGTRESFVALAYAAGILVFCLLDLLLFPIPLLDNPSSYATMEGGREHVRHISDMCWTLPPIGMLCVRNKWLRNLLVFIGVAFPVLVIDRNRLFASLFSLAFVVVVRRSEAKPLPWKAVVFIGLLGASVFSVLGILRSGTLDTVTLPFSDTYRAAPPGIKWLLLYISAGPYNFGAILAKHYSNATFLINQLVPGAGSVATAGTGIPLDASNINVGTEFFPFLMAWGPAGAVLSMVGLYALLAWSVRRMHPAASLFPLLIFLRISYCCVMSPFAPQAYTFTNAGFIGVCLVLQLLAASLPNRSHALHSYP
ncbi:oligosaccharide repeat unit polymerase [Dyella choica]|uniref:Oligosaccharide repeat unit polymerase n=1 Tax=Dyella choica TaxID=1927959 RepID=A0A432M155_9GAMM|nr:oligosaccharide repeat unit polymerase [Dyella choica]RUL70909.1 oligosaccharide repeat unit polymerase [Dyella choica]